VPQFLLRWRRQEAEADWLGSHLLPLAGRDGIPSTLGSLRPSVPSANVVLVLHTPTNMNGSEARAISVSTRQSL